MPIINLVNPGQQVAAFGVDGHIVTIAGLAIDCADRQEDQLVTIEVREDSGAVQEGGPGAFLAVVEIPARTYTTQKTGETDSETGLEVSEQVADDLDPNAINITLWPATL